MSGAKKISRFTRLPNLKAHRGQGRDAEQGQTIWRAAKPVKSGKTNKPIDPASVILAVWSAD